MLRALAHLIYPKDESVRDVADPGLIEQKECHRDFALRKMSGYSKNSFLITLKNWTIFFSVLHLKMFEKKI